ncbi:MAG TPA: hypothetical protein VMY37_38385 [Thermoguttaceae bacterium]|nr:hypothetical protein [Thermoguttaceae bacterium]
MSSTMGKAFIDAEDIPLATITLRVTGMRWFLLRHRIGLWIAFFGIRLAGHVVRAVEVSE